jgi:hypothetical protein
MPTYNALSDGFTLQLPEYHPNIYPGAPMLLPIPPGYQEASPIIRHPHAVAQSSHYWQMVGGTVRIWLARLSTSRSVKRGPGTGPGLQRECDRGWGWEYAGLFK